MQIAVLSDVHSNLEAFEAVMGMCSDADQVICLGDTVGYNADPSVCLEKMVHLSSKMIMGNHDYAAATGNVSSFNPAAATAALWSRERLASSQLAVLSALPQYQTMQVGDYSIYMVHGSPDDPLNEYVMPGESTAFYKGLIARANCDVLLLGHTHVPFLMRHGGKMLLNPGSVGQPRDLNPKASYAAIEIEDGSLEVKIHRVAYDVEKAAGKVSDAGLPRVLAERLFEGW